MPKWRVMFISNTIKIVGCGMMFFAVHPLIAYAVVGLGAAAYSPAKHGILTSTFRRAYNGRRQRVDRRLTVSAIILGWYSAEPRSDPTSPRPLLAFDFPVIDTGITTAGEMAHHRGRRPLCPSPPFSIFTSRNLRRSQAPEAQSPGT